MKLSIIVPIYNISLYLKKCLDSIIKEKADDIEIILIDDGSTDGSGIICDDYQKKDNRIKVFHTKNQGASIARNTGIQLASGEYVLFVDGDDYLEDGYYHSILPYLNGDNDIIVFNYNRIIDNKIYPIVSFYDYENASTKYLLSHCIIWNKVIKRTILDKNIFPRITTCEDLYSMPLLITKTKEIIFLNKYLYNYVNRKDSAINTFSNSDDRIFAMENLYKQLNHEYPLEIEYLYIYNLIFPTLYDSVSKKCDIRYINKLVKDKYPKYYRNKYLKIQAKCYLILVYYNLTFLAKFIIYIKIKMTRIK